MRPRAHKASRLQPPEPCQSRTLVKTRRIGLSSWRRAARGRHAAAQSWTRRQKMRETPATNTTERGPAFLSLEQCNAEEDTRRQSRALPVADHALARGGGGGGGGTHETRTTADGRADWQRVRGRSPRSRFSSLPCIAASPANLIFSRGVTLPWRRSDSGGATGNDLAE